MKRVTLCSFVSLGAQMLCVHVCDISGSAVTGEKDKEEGAGEGGERDGRVFTQIYFITQIFELSRC